MTVDLLVVRDCPNEVPAWALLRRALDESGLQHVQIQTRVITDPAEAVRLNFLGSPSFSVNGRDVFAEPGRSPGITCRVYPGPAGPAGLPTLSALTSALLDVTHQA